MANTPRIDNLESGDNLILNGNMDFWQEENTYVAAADATYVADLFRYGKNGTMVHTVARSTDVPDVKSTYSLGTTVTTAQASVTGSNFSAIRYAVEGYSMKPFAGEIMTLSFQVKATKTGIYSIGLRNNNGTRSYVAEYTISTTNTWTPVQITFTQDVLGSWDYTDGLGLEIFFVQAVGPTLASSPGVWQTGGFLGSVNQVNNCDTNGNIFRISQVMLRKGSSVGMFKRNGKNIGEELRSIQRYVIVEATTISGWWGGSGNHTGALTFPVTMRLTPTMSYISGGTSSDGTSGGAVTGATFISSTTRSTRVNLTSGYGSTTGRAMVSENFRYKADARL